MPSQPRQGWTQEEIGWAQVNPIFGNFKCLEEVGSEAPAFKREEAELEKLFFIELKVQASH